MKNKKLLLLRYFILIILIFSIISQENANINAFGIILILLLIINNQMRIFTLENRKRLFCLSIILEWVLSFIIYKNYGGFLIFYFIISIIDGTILLENKFSILFNIFTIFIMIFMSKKFRHRYSNLQYIYLRHNFHIIPIYKRWIFKDY